MNYPYTHAVLGGTFDKFHAGHKKLIDAAFSQSEKVTIGISTEKLYKDKLLSSIIEPYAIREAAINSYLKDNNLAARVTLLDIDSIYGSTLHERNIDAIFVTDESKLAAEIINEKRRELGFPLLKIIVVPFVFAEDGEPISSERIRKGQIDRDGFAYRSLFQNKNLLLPKQYRAQLRQPIGEVSKDIDSLVASLSEIVMTITVGDIVTYSLTESDERPDVSVIDFKTRRQELGENKTKLLEAISASAVICQNQAGKIEWEAVWEIGNAYERFLVSQDKQTIKIMGEEDLLTLPAILLAPLGSVVIYGQYDEGAVLVQVTEDKKREVVELIQLFTQE